MNLLKIPSIHKLEVLKIIYKINTKTLSNCFSEFLQIPSKMHYYRTRFAYGNNYSLICFNKTNSQRSIRNEGPKLSNELSNKLKSKASKSTKLFLKNIQN